MEASSVWVYASNDGIALVVVDRKVKSTMAITMPLEMAEKMAKDLKKRLRLLHRANRPSRQTLRRQRPTLGMVAKRIGDASSRKIRAEASKKRK